MLYGVEYQLAGMQARSKDSGFKFYEQLSLGLETIKNKYDIIIIDSPPALGMMSLNILYAANALIIPTPPALYDFSSTKQFFTALVETIGAIGEINLNFFRVLISRYDVTSDAQNLFAALIRDTFSNMCMDAGLLKTDEILKASGLYTTVYELDSPTSSRKTYNRAINILNGVCSEVELLIRQTWPSHMKKMREQGII
jgi:chromosome partitioning protein